MPKAGRRADENSAIAQAVQAGVALHRRGLLDDAERLYASVLKLAPDHFDALHLLGVARQQRGDSAEAVRLIGLALKVKANSAEALDNYGQILLHLRRHTEALASFDKALAIAPDQPDFRLNRTTALLELGRHAEALADADHALKLDPRNAVAFAKRGNALSALDRHEEAVASYDRALAIDPALPPALNNRGFSLGALGRTEEALASYDAVLALKPDHIEALVNRGNALAALGQHEQAIASYDRVVAQEPAHITALNNRSASLAALGRTEQALANYDAVLALKPDHVDALINRGNMLVELHREQEAEDSFHAALAHAPEQHEALFNLGVVRLRLGDFARGWDGFEWRWKAKEFERIERPYPHPRWQGERVQGRLLVWSEQGLGDEILFASMFPDLVSLAEKVVVEVEPRLVSLFSRSFPAIEVVARGRELYTGPVDAQIPMGSVGRYLRRSEDAFPFRERGFLVADPGRTAGLRRRLSDGRRVIGLSWRSRNPKFESFKSTALRDFEPVLRLADCRFVDLQYGDTRAEREAIGRDLSIQVERLDDIDNTNDIDGLASLVLACDTVVTVSNTTAHLAGALGQETFVLAASGRGRMWCWTTEREDSLWYPRVRLKQQRRFQPWSELLQAVAAEISGRSGQRPL